MQRTQKNNHYFDKQMKYTGRIAVTIFVFVISIYWHIKLHSLDYFQFTVTIAYCIFAWFLGKQFDKAKFYSEKDVLTNIYNRRFVLQAFPKFITSASKFNEKVGLAILDVDNFKEINDLYGHEMGDKVLQLISHTLIANTRKPDLIVRWGGDEFIIIAPNIDYLSTILKRFESELSVISEKLQLEISVSIGTAIYPSDGTKLSNLLRIADQNMYKSKMDRKKINSEISIPSTSIR